METKHANGAHVQNGVAKENTKPASGPEVKKEQANGKTETGKDKPATIASPESSQNGQEKAEPQKPAPAQTVKEEAIVIPLMNLDTKLKVVDELHRKSIQRLNLIRRKSELEAFEVTLASENDELNDNPYQGCKLIIQDDKQRQFITTTPGLIRLVAQYIFDACDVKLREIEASIVFPGI